MVFAEDHVARLLEGKPFPEPRLPGRAVVSENLPGQEGEHFLLFIRPELVNLLDYFASAHTLNLTIALSDSNPAPAHS